MIFGLLQPASGQFWAKFGFSIPASYSNCLKIFFFQPIGPKQVYILGPIVSHFNY